MTTAATFDLPRTGLIRAINRISFCISKDKTRPQICGMLLEAADAPGNIRFVATDGHRLGYAEVPVLDGSSALPAPGVMIPPKAVMRLFENLSKLSEAAATVSIEAGSIKVRCGRACVGAKLVGETFPDYRGRVLASRDKPKDVVVDAGDLFDAVFSTVGDEHRRVALKLMKGRIIIPSADGAVSVPCTTPKNWKPLTIGFNRNYLLDVLDGLRGNDVTLHLVSPADPMSFEAAGITGLFYIVMPMRL